MHYLWYDGNLSNCGRDRVRRGCTAAICALTLTAVLATVLLKSSFLGRYTVLLSNSTAKTAISIRIPGKGVGGAQTGAGLLVQPMPSPPLLPGNEPGNPLSSYFFGEENAVNRIFSSENRITQETDDAYGAAERRAVENLKESIQRSIEREIRKRVHESIRRSAFERIEKNLAAALDDKKAVKEIVGRIDGLDQRIQNLEKEIRTQVARNPTRRTFPS